MSTPPDAELGPGVADGRRLRRQHNREAVLGALIALFREGRYQPGAEEIALRAGLSPRSLFRYFDDVDDLNRAAIDWQLAAARPLLDVGVEPTAPIDVKVTALAEARVRLFEEIAPAARAGRLCAHRHEVVARQLHQGRAALRTQLRRLFAPELVAAGADVLPAIDVLCSFESFELLRIDQRLSRPKVVATLVTALHALLVPGTKPDS